MWNNTRQKILSLYEKHETRAEILFFVGGFVFDVFMISDVDDLFGIFQQAFYLLVIAFFIHHEILFRLQKWRPTGGLSTRIWTYRNLILHFLLGSLLSLYSLFYIKSSSLISSLIFLVLMVVLLVANELPSVKKSAVSLKTGLFAICLFSFMSVLFPVFLGFVGWLPFGLSAVSTVTLFYAQFRLLKRRIPEGTVLFDALILPCVSIMLLFTFFYGMGWIPPVPLSVKEQGIYHLVEKKEGLFYLSTEKEEWKFWLSGDQDFKARPGDKVYFYAQIYSPGGFSDDIFIRWLFKDPVQGWQKTDRLKLPILGGRKEGFRAFAFKSNFQPGQWRVQVETAMGHEISRQSFEVTTVSGDQPREFRVLVR